MPKLEKPPPLDLLEKDNESDDFENYMRSRVPQKKKKSQNKKKPKPKNKLRNFDMFETCKQPKKDTNPRKKRKLKRMSKSEVDDLLGLKNM